MHKIIFCSSCEAEFSLRHDLDEDHYRVEFCPFCAEELDMEDEYEIDEEDDE